MPAIITRNSAIPAVVPSAGQLLVGELAVNVADRKLYTLDGSNNVILLAAGGVSPTDPFSITVNSALPGLTVTQSGSGGAAVFNNSGSGDAVRITQTGAGNALVVEDSTNPDSTPFVVDTSGQVLMGLTTARNTFSGGTVTPAVQIEQVTGGRLSVTRNSANSTAPDFIFGKTRGTALNAVDAVASGDNLGTISFQGADGTNLISAANIVAAVDGTPGTNDMPGRLVFSTTADGASSPTERMRIDSAGRVGIATTSPTNELTVNGSIRAYGALTESTTDTGVFAGIASATPRIGLFNGTASQNWQIDNSSGLVRVFTPQLNGGKGIAFTINANNGITVGSGSAGAGQSFVVSRGLTGAVGCVGILSNGAIDADATGITIGVRSVQNFRSNTLPTTTNSFRHFDAVQGTQPSGSILSQQIGFLADSLTAGTSTVGVWVNIADGNSTNASLLNSTLSTISSSGTTVTVTTTAAHGYATGQAVTVPATANIVDLVSGVACTLLSLGTTTSLPGAASASVTFSDFADTVTYTAHGMQTGVPVFFSSITGTTGISVNTIYYTINITTNTFQLAATPGGAAIALTTDGSGTCVQGRFTATGAGTGTATVTLNQQNSGRTITVTGTNTFTYTTTISATYSAIPATGTITPVQRYGFYAPGTAPHYLNGRVGIGANQPDSAFTVNLPITSGSIAYGIRNYTTVPSNLTNAYYSFESAAYTAASSFNLNFYCHFTAVQPTALGAGSSISNQYAYYVTSSVTGATTNVGLFVDDIGGAAATTGKNMYGVYSSVSAASGGGTAWNIYSPGSADNYFAGNVGIGQSPPSNSHLAVRGTHASSSGFAQAVYAAGLVDSSTTTRAEGFLSGIGTADAAFTCPSLSQFYATQGTITGGSRTAVTAQYGFHADSTLTGATNNYGFFSNIASGTGRWNFYANGTAANVFAGTTSIGGLVGAESLRVQPIASAVNWVQVAGAATGLPPSIISNGSDTNIELVFGSKGTGAIDLRTNGGLGGVRQFYVTHTASAVNYVQVTGATTGNGPSIVAAGSDTNVNLNINTKGTGILSLDCGSTSSTTFGIELGAGTTVNRDTYIDFHSSSGTDYDFRFIRNNGVNNSANFINAGSGGIAFQTNSGTTQFNILHTASAVNYLQATGSATTAPPVLSAQGSDTNIDLTLTPKGTGVVRSSSAVAATTVLTGGYVAHSAGTTAMAFASYSVVRVTPNATATYTTTVPPAGTRCTLSILTSGSTSYTITFGTGFKTTGTLATGATSARYFQISFVSDGTNLLETSRTTAIA